MSLGDDVSNVSIESVLPLFVVVPVFSFMFVSIAEIASSVIVGVLIVAVSMVMIRPLLETLIGAKTYASVTVVFMSTTMAAPIIRVLVEAVDSTTLKVLERVAIRTLLFLFTMMSFHLFNLVSKIMLILCFARIKRCKINSVPFRDRNPHYRSHLCLSCD